MTELSAKKEMTDLSANKKLTDFSAEKNWLLFEEQKLTDLSAKFFFYLIVSKKIIICIRKFPPEKSDQEFLRTKREIVLMHRTTQLFDNITNMACAGKVYYECCRGITVSI